MALCRRFRCVPSSISGQAGTPAFEPFEKQLPIELVARSQVLQTAVAATAEDDVTVLQLPQCADSTFLDAWSMLVQKAATRRRLHRQLAVESVLCGLQAADFFVDEESISDFCFLLAQHCFFPPTPSVFKAKSKKRERSTSEDLTYNIAQRQANEKIFDQLSPHLAHLTLRSENVDVLRCIKSLPDHFIHLVIEGQYPSAARDHSLTLSRPQSGLPSLTEDIILLSAVSSLSQLTFLCLSSTWYCDGWLIPSEQRSSTCNGWEMTWNKHEEDARDTITSMFSCLTHLVSLSFQDGIHRVASYALLDSAAHLTALASLGISGKGTALNIQDLPRLTLGLRTLTALKSLSLDGYVVHSNQPRHLTEDVCEFFGDLEKMTALTSLTLNRCVEVPSSKYDVDDIIHGWYRTQRHVQYLLCPSWRSPMSSSRSGSKLPGLIQLLKSLCMLQNLVLDHTITDLGCVGAFEGIETLSRLTRLSSLAPFGGGVPAARDLRATDLRATRREACLGESLHKLTGLASLDLVGYVVATLGDIMSLCSLTLLTRLSLGASVVADGKGVVRSFFTQFGRNVTALVDLHSFALIDWPLEKAVRSEAEDGDSSGEEVFDEELSDEEMADQASGESAAVVAEGGDASGEESWKSAADLGALVKGLGSLKCLRAVGIIGCTANEDVVLATAEKLPCLRALTRLALGVQLVGECPRGEEELAASVRRLTTLQELHLDSAQQRLSKEVFDRALEMCEGPKIRCVPLKTLDDVGPEL